MDLYAFRDSVNSGEDYTRISVTLLAVIYAEGMDDWEGIGTMETPFNGRFYGSISGCQATLSDCVKTAISAPALTTALWRL